MTRNNYSYIRYQKELAKKKKLEEKKQSKLDKKNAQAKDNQAHVPDTDIPGV